MVSRLVAVVAALTMGLLFAGNIVLTVILVVLAIGAFLLARQAPREFVPAQIEDAPVSRFLFASGEGAIIWLPVARNESAFSTCRVLADRVVLLEDGMIVQVVEIALPRPRAASVFAGLGDWALGYVLKCSAHLEFINRLATTGSGDCQPLH